jgi:YVTN family beta-propeller protein
MGWHRRGSLRIAAAGLLGAVLPAALAQSSFVNWETPHVSPLDRSPSGELLFAVNTADNRLEIFDITLGTAVWQASVPVGLDPVSVRARTDDEVWVVNHVSDSISIVNVATRNVARTLLTGDEPTDVVFANGRAFVTLSQLNQLAVYNLANLAAAPTIVNIEGEDPRALAVSHDGTRVYAAIFDSGNGTTILTTAQVSSGASPYGGVNPPPNSGTQFSPPQRAGNPAPPPVALIVK